MSEQPNNDLEQDAMERMYDILWTYHRYWDSDIGRAIDMLREGRAIAEQLADERMRLEMEHWLMQAHVFQLHDYKTTLPMAVKAAVAVRKPDYADWRIRICVHQDLIYSYVGTDAEGYAEMIEQALDYMQSEAKPGVQCINCLQGTRAAYEWAMGRWDKVREASLRQLSLTSWAHHQTGAYADLARVAFVENDLTALASYTAQMIEKATASDRPMAIATGEIWLAYLAQCDGDEAEGKRWYGTAVKRARTISTVWSDDFYMAIVAYHDLRGEYALAEDWCRTQLQGLVDKHAWQEELEARFRLCQLLEKQDFPLDEEVIKAQTIAQNLKKPKKWLDRFARFVTPSN